jgi:hypothetical protein
MNAQHAPPTREGTPRASRAQPVPARPLQRAVAIGIGLLAGLVLAFALGLLGR